MALMILGFSAVADAGGARTAAEQADKVMARLDVETRRQDLAEGGRAGREARPALRGDDENKDGFVSKAELVAALERVRARGGGPDRASLVVQVAR